MLNWLHQNNGNNSKKKAVKFQVPPYLAFVDFVKLSGKGYGKWWNNKKSKYMPHCPYAYRYQSENSRPWRWVIINKMNGNQPTWKMIASWGKCTGNRTLLHGCGSVVFGRSDDYLENIIKTTEGAFSLVRKKWRLLWRMHCSK